MKREDEATPERDEDSSSFVEALPLVEGLDYYLENGFLVFTARYLKRRGYCCENGCRHCPYNEKAVKA